ncbi:MAG: hypothetical protein H6619_05045 [Deltaproteobacteria bacterium]|nr:hypothetical protein [Deltaproteobacteria bacterium]
MNPNEAEAGPSGPSFWQQQRGQFEQAGASGPFLDAIGDLWSRCTFGPACLTPAREHLTAAGEELKAALASTSRGTSEAQTGFILMLEEAGSTPLDVVRSRFSPMCDACFAGGPQGAEWKRLVSRALFDLVNPRAGGKLCLEVVEALDGVPALSVSLSRDGDPVSSFEYPATREVIDATSRLIDPRQICQTSALIASRALGHIGGPTTALPHSVLEIKHVDDLELWNRFYNSLNALAAAN